MEHVGHLGHPRCLSRLVNVGRYRNAERSAQTFEFVQADALDGAAEVCRSVIEEENERTRGFSDSGAYQVGAGCCEDAIRALLPPKETT